MAKSKGQRPSNPSLEALIEREKNFRARVRAAHVARAGWEPTGSKLFGSSVFQFYGASDEAATYVVLRDGSDVAPKLIPLELPNTELEKFGVLFELREKIAEAQASAFSLSRSLADVLQQSGLSVRVAGAALGVSGARFRELLGLRGPGPRRIKASAERK